jgi:hypothetical protein
MTTILAALALAAVLTGCKERKDPGFQGWVEADMIFVSPDESGRVTKLSVREGDEVMIVVSGSLRSLLVFFSNFGTAYVTLSGFRDDDPLAHVYRTTDFGTTWTPINSNLPEAPVNDLEIKLVDATGLNVWRHVLKKLQPPARWKNIKIDSREMEFAWGPASGGVMNRVANTSLKPIMLTSRGIDRPYCQSA